MTKKTKCCGGRLYFNHATGDYCCSICKDRVPITRRLDKSPRRLAMEIIGKDRIDAENHLVKYGSSMAGAAAAVSIHVTSRTNVVTGSLDAIEYSIWSNC